jgi:hypothetical protein
VANFVIDEAAGQLFASSSALASNLARPSPNPIRMKAIVGVA